jgi:hypothetical protein
MVLLDVVFLYIICSDSSISYQSLVFHLQMLRQQKDACKAIVLDKNKLIKDFQEVGDYIWEIFII